MKKQILKYGLTCLIMILGLVVTFTSCKKDDEVSATKLEVFGPCPVLRGDTLKFIGINMDKVTSVVLPNNLEVKDIIKKGSTQIDIIVPQTAVQGFVTLKTPTGDITTITKLTFSEPISISKFAPSTVLAGDKLTIEGDYLNLIASVIFTNGIAVDSADFVSQSRYKIEVTVPKEAQTGKFQISNGAEIPTIVYSASALTVTQPTITAVSPNPVKAGSTVTVTGTNFQLVKSLIFNEGLSVTDFTVNDAKNTITAKVPATAKDGKVKLVTYSGVEIESASDVTLVAPAVTGINPATVKNGATLSITGTDLDLVTSVVFADGSNGTIATQSATKIDVTVPMTATDGKIVLNTNSGKTAETPAITTVKPTITTIAPLALMAGNNITITGTDLDLVRKVTFVGGLSVDVNPTGSTSFTVTVPPACVGTAAVVLTTTNGTTVTSTDQVAVEAANKPVITGITSTVKPGAMLTITGTKLNQVESIYFQDNVKAILYGLRTENTIEVYVPETAKKGTVTLKLVSFAGDEIVSPEFIISGTDPVLDPSYVFFNFDGKNSWWGDKGAVENNPDLSLDGSSYFRVNDDMNPWWTGFFWRNGRNDLKTDGVTISDWAVKIDVNVLADISGDMKFRLKGSDGDFWSVIHGLKNKGGWYTVTLPLTSFIIDGGTTVLPNLANVDSDFGMAYTGPGEHVNMCIDNVRFEKISGSSGAPAFKLVGF